MESDRPGTESRILICKEEAIPPSRVVEGQKTYLTKESYDSYQNKSEFSFWKSSTQMIEKLRK